MPPGIGHDDKDPGSMNYDVGYIETKHKGETIYKPYIRRYARVYPGAPVDFVNRKYYLVEDKGNGDTPQGAVAKINIAVLTYRTPDESTQPYGDGEPLLPRAGVDGMGLLHYSVQPDTIFQRELLSDEETNSLEPIQTFF